MSPIICESKYRNTGRLAPISSNPPNIDKMKPTEKKTFICGADFAMIVDGDDADFTLPILAVSLDHMPQQFEAGLLR